jgi:membrane protein implicated in regulation of membrane protease activity
MSTKARLAWGVGVAFTTSLAVTPAVPLWVTLGCWVFNGVLLLWLGSEHFFGAESPHRHSERVRPCARLSTAS